MERVHFEENLSSENATGGGYKWIVIGIAVLLLVPPVIITVGFLVFTPFDVFELVSKLPPVFLVVPLIIILGFLMTVFVVVGIIYLFQKGEVNVRVTDTGVEIEKKHDPFSWDPGTEIPFDEITKVEYSEVDELHLHVQQEDSDAKAFMVQNPWRRRKGGTFAYPGGVRIERKDDLPVYVGSTRPVELSEAIVRRVDGVEKPEKLSMETKTISL